MSAGERRSAAEKVARAHFLQIYPRKEDLPSQWFFTCQTPRERDVKYTYVFEVVESSKKELQDQDARSARRSQDAINTPSGFPVAVKGAS